MEAPKVLFISKKRNDPYGISYGLYNSATFVTNYVGEYLGFETRFVQAVDGNEIDRVVTGYDPSHVVLEALWATPAKMDELMSLHRHRNRVWVIRTHSKFSFLANEGMACSWLWGYQHVSRKHHYNLILAPNTEGEAKDLAEVFDFGPGAQWLPNIYRPQPTDLPISIEKAADTLDVGCLGAIRPMKNTLTQAIAAMKYCDRNNLRLRFHVNGNRLEQKGEAVHNNMRSLFAGHSGHELVEHRWRPHDEFIALVKGLDLGMQVSFSETFCIVAADFVSNGIPFVGSKEVPFLPGSLQADPTSTESIVTAMGRALGWYGGFLRRRARSGLEAWNRRAESIWESFFWETV